MSGKSTTVFAIQTSSTTRSSAQRLNPFRQGNPWPRFTSRWGLGGVSHGENRGGAAAHRRATFVHLKWPGRPLRSVTTGDPRFHGRWLWWCPCCSIHHHTSQAWRVEGLHRGAGGRRSRLPHQGWNDDRETLHRHCLGAGCQGQNNNGVDRVAG